MTEILKNCDYKDIQSLRKTCRRIRKLVDLIKPVSPVTWINIRSSDISAGIFQVYSIVNMCIGFENKPFLDVSYWDNKCRQTPKCAVRNQRSKKRHFFKNISIFSVFWQDFKILLASVNKQKEPIDKLLLELEDNVRAVFEESVVQLFQERSYKLQVKNLDLKCQDSSIISLVLSLVSKDTLEKLEIKTTHNQDSVLDLQSMSELEQCKNLKKMHIKGIRVENVRSFLQFPHLDVQCRTISPEDASFLTETFLSTPTFECWTIVLDDFENRFEVLQAIFPDVEENARDADWFFDIERITPGKLLRILTSQRTLSFQIADVADLDEQGVVLV